jgi:hypothetical protein
MCIFFQFMFLLQRQTFYLLYFSHAKAHFSQILFFYLQLIKYFLLLLSPPPRTSITMTIMLTKFQLWIEFLNSLMESMWKN